MSEQVRKDMLELCTISSQGIHSQESSEICQAARFMFTLLLTLITAPKNNLNLDQEHLLLILLVKQDSGNPSPQNEQLCLSTHLHKVSPPCQIPAGIQDMHACCDDSSMACPKLVNFTVKQMQFTCMLLSTIKLWILRICILIPEGLKLKWKVVKHISRR